MAALIAHARLRATIACALVGAAFASALGASAPAAALGSASVPSFGTPARATVVRVVDGDTIIVRKAGRTIRIQLRNVEAPDEGACFYGQARAGLRKLLPVGSRITFNQGPNADESGRFPVTGVQRGDLFIEQALAARGLVEVFEGVEGEEELQSAAGRARSAGRGLYGACEEWPLSFSPTQQAQLVDDFRREVTGRSFLIPAGNGVPTPSRLDMCPGDVYRRSTQVAPDGSDTAAPAVGTWSIPSLSGLPGQDMSYSVVLGPGIGGQPGTNIVMRITGDRYVINDVVAQATPTARC